LTFFFFSFSAPEPASAIAPPPETSAWPVMLSSANVFLGFGAFVPGTSDTALRQQQDKGGGGDDDGARSDQPIIKQKQASVGVRDSHYCRHYCRHAHKGPEGYADPSLHPR
jgi:hypothetical protein